MIVWPDVDRMARAAMAGRARVRVVGGRRAVELGSARRVRAAEHRASCRPADTCRDQHADAADELAREPVAFADEPFHGAEAVARGGRHADRASAGAVLDGRRQDRVRDRRILGISGARSTSTSTTSSRSWARPTRCEAVVRRFEQDHRYALTFGDSGRSSPAALLPAHSSAVPAPRGPARCWYLPPCSSARDLFDFAIFGCSFSVAVTFSRSGWSGTILARQALERQRLRVHRIRQQRADIRRRPGRSR